MQQTVPFHKYVHLLQIGLLGARCYTFSNKFHANLDRKRQIWTAAWCGLGYVSHYKVSAAICL